MTVSLPAWSAVQLPKALAAGGQTRRLAATLAPLCCFSVQGERCLWFSMQFNATCFGPRFSNFLACRASIPPSPCPRLLAHLCKVGRKGRADAALQECADRCLGLGVGNKLLQRAHNILQAGRAMLCCWYHA